ncbi:8-oxo-dGTP pyrophosphatase MutT (NUDIX family) [Priestia taiwanensis]|nr:8-oxo-dGTP pyrophosphatase MutT (NUDIX family) [Priestia taiwanensis]
MMITKYVHWGEASVKLTWIHHQELPPSQLITSVHGFCFKDDKIMLVNLHERGWDFPGGHIEEESAEACFKREALEEGYVEGVCELLGHIIVDHSENTVWNENSPYPKVGYQVFYRMDIDTIHSFDGQFESKDRVFIHPDEVSVYYHKWNDLYEGILCAALEVGE